MQSAEPMIRANGAPESSWTRLLLSIGIRGYGGSECTKDDAPPYKAPRVAEMALQVNRRAGCTHRAMRRLLMFRDVAPRAGRTAGRNVAGRDEKYPDNFRAVRVTPDAVVPLTSGRVSATIAPSSSTAVGA